MNYVGAMENITIFFKIACPFYLREDACSLLAEVVGVCCTLWLSIEDLKLRAKGDRMEFLTRNLFSPFT
jgi:hypothetical protein